MRQSRVRRGLAASAVGALAVTGLAVAAPAARAADGPGLELLSQQHGRASLRPDGGTENLPTQYVDLVAARTDPALTIHVEVNADADAGDADPGWEQVGAEAAPPGAFVTKAWDGTIDGASAVGTSVAVRAVGVDGARTTYDTVHDVAVTGTESPVHSVSVRSTAPGYFAQPYADSGRTRTQVRVEGTTSATTGTAQLSWWDPAAREFRGQVDAALTPYDLKVSPDTSTPTVAGGQFRAALDITGYDAAASGGRLAVRAERDSDEVAVLTPYAQGIGSVVAYLRGSHSDGTSTLQVAVTDQSSEGIVGAEVRRMSDGALVGWTDGTGSVTTTQVSGTSERYYANATDADGFDAAVDRATAPIEPPVFTPVPRSAALVLADGAVFDDDEYAAGDVALQSLDQEGRPYAGEAEIAYLLRTPGRPDPEPTVGTSDGTGRLVVPFDPAGPDGRYEVDLGNGPGAERVAGGRAGQDPASFIAGDATLSLVRTTPAPASGGRATYAGRLAIGEHPLPGRRVDLRLDRGTEAVPGRTADATLAGGATTTTVTTGDDGTFTVTVADAAERGGPSETGGVLTATAPSARETATAAVDFGAGVGTFRLRLTGRSSGAGPDRLTVGGDASVAGERVTVLARIGRRWKAVTRAVLDRTGGASVKVRDRNGAAPTRYRVRLLASSRVRPSTSRTTTVR